MITALFHLRFCRGIARWWAACALAAFAPAIFAQATFPLDLSDLYGTASESGWGMQLTQQDDVAFATLYVYDASDKPTFLISTLTQAAGSTWSGDLFRTMGPFLGAATWDPSLLGIAKVGTMTLIRTSADTATLQYSVDGVAVTKNISRGLLRYDNYAGSYTATVNVVTSHCSNSADNGAQVGSYVIGIVQNGTDMTITGKFAKRGTSTCSYYGTYTQAGRAGALGSAYTCSDGDEGSMSFFEMTKRPGMFSGWLQGHSITDSCDYSGTMTGLIPF